MKEKQQNNVSDKSKKKENGLFIVDYHISNWPFRCNNKHKVNKHTLEKYQNNNNKCNSK